MYVRPSPLFDTARSALLLRAEPGTSLVPSTPLPNAMRANDLPRRSGPGRGTSSPATYGPTRELSTWKP